MDRRVGVIDSLKHSWQATATHMWSIFGLLILVLLMSFVLTLACYLPVLFLGIPLSLGILGAAYHQIVGNPDAQAEMPD